MLLVTITVLKKYNKVIKCIEKSTWIISKKSKYFYFIGTTLVQIYVQ